MHQSETHIPGTFAAAAILTASFVLLLVGVVATLAGLAVAFEWAWRLFD